MRNKLLEIADTDWVFYLDADEIVTAGLKREIEVITASGASGNLAAAYFIRRRSIYFGRHIWPVTDKVERLFWRKALRYWTGKLHESPVYVGDSGVLDTPLNHYTHRNLTEMTEKTNSWSVAESKLRFDANHPRVVWWRIIRVILTGFTDTYIGKSGWKAGVAGLTESIFQAFSMFVTYSKLWEMQQKKS